MSDTKEINHRKHLSQGQLEIVKVLYKYRFGTVSLLQDSLKVNASTTLYRKLKILCDEGYVGKEYRNAYKLQGIPAAYYLQTRAFRELQKLPDYPSIDEKLVKYSQKDKTLTRGFLELNLKLFEITNHLTKLYPALRLFTKRELSQYKHLPYKLVDGFISLKAEGANKPQRYFINIIPEDMPRHVVEDLVAKYYDFFEYYDWEDKTKSKVPAILFVCDTGKYERKLQKYVSRKQNMLGSDSLHYFTSTLQAVHGFDLDNTEIWSSVEDPDELLSLISIL